MKFELRKGVEVTAVELGDGESSVGGGPEDAIRIDGLAPGVLDLLIEANRVLAVAHQCFRIDGVPSPIGIARWLLEGEIVELTERIQLQLLPGEPVRDAPQTAAVLRSFLRDSVDRADLKCAHLVCLTGLDLGRRFPLTRGRTEVGRGKDVDVRIRDRAVSRTHALLRRTPTGYFVEDNGSPNGVYVDGQRIAGPTLLNDGAVIELGYALLRFKGPWREPEPITAAPEEPVEGLPGPGNLHRRAELTLFCLGAVLAVFGVMVTYGFAVR